MCYGGKRCVQQRDLLCWVLKLSAACDKGEGSRYVHLNIIHSRWTLVLQLEWSALQWTLSGRYFTAGGQWYCSLNGVCYSEHYLEDTSQPGGQVYCSLNGLWYIEPYMEGTSQQVDSVIAAWMQCVTANIMWKVLQWRWTVVMQLEWSVLLWTLSGRYFTAGGQSYCSLNGIVLLWTLYGRYFTAGGQWYCSLNGVCCIEHYMEDTSE